MREVRSSEFNLGMIDRNCGFSTIAVMPGNSKQHFSNNRNSE